MSYLVNDNNFDTDFSPFMSTVLDNDSTYFLIFLDSDFHQYINLDNDLLPHLIMISYVLDNDLCISLIMNLVCT